MSASVAPSGDHDEARTFGNWLLMAVGIAGASVMLGLGGAAALREYSAPVPAHETHQPAAATPIEPREATVPIQSVTAMPTVAGFTATATSGTTSAIGWATSGVAVPVGVTFPVPAGAPNPTSASPAPSPAVRPVPAVQSFAFDERGLAEYRAVATQIGAVPAELTIADFRAFLAGHKIPTFELAKVVPYMDKIAAIDNPDRWGWHWAPVRTSDARDIKLGTESAGYICNGCMMTTSNVVMVGGGGGGGAFLSQRSAASDHYNGGKTPYGRTIPLHALQLIALIEQQFGAGRVAFMISDYTTEPDRIVVPDPFLMAVIPNDKLSKGEGRFIIDAWDEPGFGVGPKDTVTAP